MNINEQKRALVSTLVLCSLLLLYNTRELTGSISCLNSFIYNNDQEMRDKSNSCNIRINK